MHPRGVGRVKSSRTPPQRKRTNTTVASQPSPNPPGLPPNPPGLYFSAAPGCALTFLCIAVPRVPQVLELRRIFLLLRVAFEIGLLIVLYYLIVAVIGLSLQNLTDNSSGLVGAIYLLALGKLATVAHSCYRGHCIRKNHRRRFAARHRDRDDASATLDAPQTVCERADL